MSQHLFPLLAISSSLPFACAFVPFAPLVSVRAGTHRCNGCGTLALADLELLTKPTQ